MKLWKYLKEHMVARPDGRMQEGDKKLTFSEIVSYAESFSRQLVGVKCCAILCKSELMSALAILCCFVGNVTALPLSERYGEKHCNKIMETISPDAVITDNNGVLNVAVIENSRYKVPEIHPAVIMCTSGTSGTPKGVMLTEENIICNVGDIAEYFGINSNDRILISRPIHHCAVLSGELLVSLVKGADIVFYSGKFNPCVIEELIVSRKITAFCTTPTQLCMIMKLKRRKIEDCLKHITVSGECMDMDTVDRVLKLFKNSKIYHAYGLTEASPRVCFLPPEHFSEYPMFVGKPLKSVSLKIVCDDGRPADINEEGMLYVCGKNVMSGYYNDREKTEKAIVDGWLCTGDIAKINEKGLLKIMGRADGMIIRSGMNIYPAEIENALKTDKRVKEILAYGLKEENGTRVAVKIAGEFSSEKEVRELCRRVLPEYQIPGTIQLVNAIEKNASGKLIRG